MRIGFSNLPLNAIAFGSAGIGCKVIEVHSDGVILMHPETGKTKRVLYNAIVHWEPPPDTSTPQPGDRVRLKNTNLFYTLMDVFEVPYWINGDRTVELWARCQAVDGQVATWKLCQLEIITLQ